MIVYHASKKGFIKDVFNNTIADDIDHAFLLHLGRHTSPNEKLSWKNSMMHMYKVINTPDIPDTSTIAIEYQIPLCRCRRQNPMQRSWHRLCQLRHKKR